MSQGLAVAIILVSHPNHAEAAVTVETEMITGIGTNLSHLGGPLLSVHRARMIDVLSHEIVLDILL